MLRGHLGNSKYKAKFSGHDTFPFRYAWLTKLVNYLEDGKGNIIKESDKRRLETISDFGVGLNMVKSIKHWSIATKVCDKDFKLTDFGKLLFSKKNSFDPYLEKKETLWLLHWVISSNQTLTTWYYVFNYHQSIVINKDTLLNDLLNIGKFSKWKGLSPNTIKRDIDCFIRTYTFSSKKGEITEDSIECPLAELGLISSTYTKGEYELQKGPKLTLSDKIFEYALNDYWSKQSNNIITFEKIMYDYGSPGKVFLLDEKSMEGYLERLENDGKNFVFNKGAGGLRQITKINKISENQLLKNCYKEVA
jgi:hypothetical protein|tara:strand:+ start:428 stop:1345 length:918 start_codon:yes stop_codon:yes gene_type:complete